MAHTTPTVTAVTMKTTLLRDMPKHSHIHSSVMLLGGNPMWPPLSECHTERLRVYRQSYGKLTA